MSQDVQNIMSSYKMGSQDIDIALEQEYKKCALERGRAYTPGGVKIGKGVADLVNTGAVLYTEEKARQGYPVTILPQESQGSRYEEDDSPYDPDSVVSYKIPESGEVSMNPKSCRGIAAARVFGTIEKHLKYTNLINALAMVNQKYGIAEEIGILYKTGKEYPACMSVAGYSEVNYFGAAPQVAAKKFGQYRSEGEEANAEERALAQADYKCQQESGVVRKAEDIFYSKAAQWFKEHESLIFEIRDIEAEAKERSIKIINGEL
ncbi:MAG: hypothetical protein Q4P78_00900 [Rothia sp. (in: high G+C Gram-positive bacteria)]|uniref:hypothetical protein n=1 Tax=Rothia sp. (in: high G+C Gram-positive bacteria) TaxID=1885016 RepID=UPI0026E0B132|nr:hypothetical protein [Rothia sp. (in: high G+C Gram-positive bacteria)]MDO5749748.1 hypothetical protein [Rothia sp. (in: high G+C Gram-positive bacteria)]